MVHMAFVRSTKSTWDLDLAMKWVSFKCWDIFG